MSRVLLVGLGADIGSNLLYLSATGDFGCGITEVLTNPIAVEETGSRNRTALDELAARLVLAQPDLIGRITTDPTTGTLALDGRRFRIHFREFESDLDDLGKFDVAVLATSRSHIRSARHLSRLEKIADTVLGVAENPEIDAIYPALATVPADHLANATTHRTGTLRGSYALGSCQCAGWTTGLRVLADYCASNGFRLGDVLVHSEVDIVHPDTASSNFGTKRIGARTEDPRDNLRPGKSQVSESMQRMRPATSFNSVSLRVLTQPPGFQIQRFFLRIEPTRAGLLDAATDLARREPRQVMVSRSPIGSRAYAAMRCSTALLTCEEHLRIQRIGEITEVVMQAFVHNTLGYCAAILDTVDRILGSSSVTVVGSLHESKGR